MRLTFVLLLLGGLGAGAAAAQQPTSATAQPASDGRQVRRVMAPPKSATVQGLAARSTAQTMASHANAPLQQVPAFAVSDLSGKTTDISSFRASGHWLLLYRSEHCAACDKVMAALAKNESPLFKQGTSYVIVVKRSGAKAANGMLDQLKGNYPSLSSATWVEDVNGEGFTALKPHGEPVLYAVSGNQIAWTLHGTLKNPAMLERIASSWLASTSKPRPAVGISAPATPTAVSTSTKTTALHAH
jgi:hypothetical protein